MSRFALEGRDHRVGVDETEASALEVAKDFRRLRPLIGSRDTLKDLRLAFFPRRSS